MRRKRLGQKGFTLVELIVAIALTGILTAGLMAFLRPATMAFAGGVQSTHAKAVTNGVLTYLSEVVRYQPTVTLGDTPGTNSWYSKEGQLQAVTPEGEKAPFPPDYYQKLRLTVAFAAEGEKSVRITVTAWENEKQLHRAETTVKLVNAKKVTGAGSCLSIP